MPWLFTSVSTNSREEVPWNSAPWAIAGPGRENNPQVFPPTLRFKFRCSLILLHVYLNSLLFQSSVTPTCWLAQAPHGASRQKRVSQGLWACVQSPRVSLFRVLLQGLWGSRGLAPPPAPGTRRRAGKLQSLFSVCGCDILQPQRADLSAEEWLAIGWWFSLWLFPGKSFEMLSFKMNSSFCW